MHHGYFQIELIEILLALVLMKAYIDLRNLLRAVQPVVMLFNTSLLKTFAQVSRVLRIIKMIFSFMPKQNRRCLNALLHSLKGVNKQISLWKEPNVNLCCLQLNILAVLFLKMAFPRPIQSESYSSQTHHDKC